MTTLTPVDRRRHLQHTEANLLWLILDHRYSRAVQILADSEIQAAIIRSGGGGGGSTEGATAWSDPTGGAALTEAATEIRATEVRRVWARELAEVYDAIAAARALVDRDTPPRRGNIATALRSIGWLTVAPQNRIITTRLGDHEMAELDHAIAWARTRSASLRDGRLTTTSGKPVPSVFGVLDAARKAMKADPPKPKPVQKAPEGCISCRRDDGYFEPIDLKNHSARNMCRVCGDYYSGEGRMLPLDAVKYRHRTGKNLTWKIIEAAKRAEVAS